MVCFGGFRLSPVGIALQLGKPNQLFKAKKAERTSHTVSLVLSLRSISWCHKPAEGSNQSGVVLCITIILSLISIMLTRQFLNFHPFKCTIFWAAYSNPGAIFCGRFACWCTKKYVTGKNGCWRPKGEIESYDHSRDFCLEQVNARISLHRISWRDKDKAFANKNVKIWNDLGSFCLGHKVVWSGSYRHMRRRNFGNQNNSKCGCVLRD